MTNQIRTLREFKGLTQADLAQRVGITVPSISRIERGERVPRLETLYRIAGALACHVRDLGVLPPDDAARAAILADLDGQKAAAPAPPGQDPDGDLIGRIQTLLNNSAAPGRGPRDELARIHKQLADLQQIANFSGPTAVSQTDRRMPIMGRAQGGSDGVLLIQGDDAPIDWTYLPPQLEGVTGAFAIFVTGRSMEPVFDEGDVAWIHPSKPPRPGKPVLLVKQTSEAFIKTLVRRDAQTVTLRQFNPPGEFDVPAAELRELYAVVGRWNA